MKTIYFLLLSLALGGCTAEPMYAMDRFAALSMVESGDDDFATGAAGEVSRYQIMPEVWTATTWLPISQATNPAVALVVAKKIMAHRLTPRGRAVLVAPENVLVSDERFYLFWHRPARAFHPTPREQDRATRFANLCNK